MTTGDPPPNLKFGALFRYPRYPSDWIRYFDLTIGLVLVAVSEEVLFRSLMIKHLKATKLSAGLGIAVCCIAFGTMRWGLGLWDTIGTGIWAIPFTIYAWKTC